MMPLPTNMTLKDWSDAAVPFLSTFDSIGRLEDETKWQDWGAKLSLALSLSGLCIPNPYAFTDWRLWAQRLCEELV